MKEISTTEDAVVALAGSAALDKELMRAAENSVPRNPHQKKFRTGRTFVPSAQHKLDRKARQKQQRRSRKRNRR